MKRAFLFAAGLLIAGATPAAAQERELCPDRPGLGTPPCTVAPGHVLVETALGDWTRDDDAGSRTDTILIADTLARFGLTDTIEAQLGWTPFGHQRVRDTGVSVRDRIGDVTLGAKINLVHADGKGVSVALQPVVTLPVGRVPIGAGDWSAALAVPIAVQIGGPFSLQATPTIEAAVDEDGHGRHLSYGSVVGLGVSVSDAVDASLELQVTRDDDPADPATLALLGVALAWQPSKTLQFDVGCAAGLNHDTPDARVYAGVSHFF